MGAAATPIAMTAGVGGGLLSAYEQGQAGRAQSSYYGYLADTARTNAGLAEVTALSERRNITAQTLSEQRLLSDRKREAIGAQTAASVSGVGASSRSAQDIVKDTLNKANLDEEALRLSADMRAKNAEIGAKTSAMNAESQAAGYNIAGMNSRAAANIGQVSSLIGATGSVASSWYRRNPWMDYGGGG